MPTRSPTDSGSAARRIDPATLPTMPGDCLHNSRPPPLPDPQSEHTRRLTPDDLHLFCQIDSIFSQWFVSDFRYEGINYNCAEQCMMVHKAKIFADASRY